MMTVKDVLNEFMNILENFGDIPVVTTEENEPGKPLTPIQSVVALEAGLKEFDSDDWVNDDYDTICIVSTSKPKDVLDRIIKDL